MCSILTVDVTPRPTGSNRMVIRLAIDKTEPVTGIAEAACRCVSVPFVGWLEMLRAISDVVAADRCTRPCSEATAAASPTSTEGDQDPT